MLRKVLGKVKKTHSPQEDEPVRKKGPQGPTLVEKEVLDNNHNNNLLNHNKSNKEAQLM
ncbi:hypothetical protein A2U01_0103576, partial [Trifolium medium]|nr:hypothetical protein [Trifolium medium]